MPRKEQLTEARRCPAARLEAAHISNSFAAYRTRALYEYGRFPSTFIFSGKTPTWRFEYLLGEWSVSYRAALVRHSHDYSVLLEMKRYGLSMIKGCWDSTSIEDGA